MCNYRTRSVGTICEQLSLSLCMTPLSLNYCLYSYTQLRSTLVDPSFVSSVFAESHNYPFYCDISILYNCQYSHILVLLFVQSNSQINIYSSRVIQFISLSTFNSCHLSNALDILIYFISHDVKVLCIKVFTLRLS